MAAAALALIALLIVPGEAGAQEAESTAGEGTASLASPAQAAPSATPPADSAAGTAPARSTRLIEARARPRRAYYFGLKRIHFAIALAAKGPTDLRIDIVRAGSGLLERSITQLDVPPRSRVLIPWDGLSAAGNPVRGKLRFLVRGVNGQPIPFARRLAAQAKTKAKRKGPRLRFGLFDHIFPVRGRHSYGDGIGAPRGDHTHQGQDISAACGTRLVAAQAGTVQVAAYQAGGAGHYVVLDTVGSDIDHVYMHLLAPTGLVPGQLVMTGQQFGQVGNTGSSSGCHLHFEMWSGPGWYEGGAFMDPTPYMRAWDRYS